MTELALKHAIKSKWVKAPRSGEYDQGTGWLKDEYGGYCCLGVLCMVIAPRKWKEHRHDGALSFPGRNVLKAAGVAQEDVSTHPFWKLAKLNDAGTSFAKIADIIEAEF